MPESKAPLPNYAEVTKVLIAASDPKNKANRVEPQIWEKYTKGDKPIVEIEKGSPPRVNYDVFMQALEVGRSTAPEATAAKEMTTTAATLNRGRAKDDAKVERTMVMTVLTSPPGKHQIEQFNEVRDLLDREKGGLSKEGWDKYKNDPKVVDAAKTQRESWAQKPELKTQAQAADRKATDSVVAKTADIMALLTAKPGERPIEDPDKNRATARYRAAAAALDPDNGGLTREAYNGFKASADKGNETSKAVLAAAALHRENFVKPAPKAPLTAENAPLVIQKLNRRTEDKPLTDQEFAQIGHMFYGATGALTKAALKQAEDGKLTDVVKANTDRLSFNQERMDEKTAMKAQTVTQTALAPEAPVR